MNLYNTTTVANETSENARAINKSRNLHLPQVKEGILIVASYVNLSVVAASRRVLSRNAIG